MTEDGKGMWDKVAEEHHREVSGKGRWPLDHEYIEEFITRQVRKGPEWAIAYALMQVAGAIRYASGTVAGVDDWTGQMRMSAALEAIAEVIKGKNGGGNEK